MNDAIARSVVTAVVVVAVVMVVKCRCQCQCSGRGRRAAGNPRSGSHCTRCPRYSNNTRPHTATLDARGHGTARPVSRRTTVDVDSGRCGAAASCRCANEFARARASARVLDDDRARAPPSPGPWRGGHRPPIDIRRSIRASPRAGECGL